MVEGRLSRDTEVLGQMDPFVQIQYSKDTQFQTNVISNGGKNPTWNQTFEVPIYKEEHYLRIDCLDKDIIADDLIGHTLVQASQLIGCTGQHRWLSIYYKKKESGRLLLEVHYYPEGVPVLQQVHK